jgi:hypothetical protein
MGSLVFILIFMFAGVLIFSLGLIVDKYKQYDLISGYNTMSEEKKARFDIKPEIGNRKSIPSLNCSKTAPYTHLSQLTIAVLRLVSLSACFIEL